jgi:hypothetical protein
MRNIMQEVLSEVVDSGNERSARVERVGALTG